MEGDDDELEDSECLSRLLEDVQSVHVVSSYSAHVLTRHGVYFTQRLQLCVIYRLFKGGVYSCKYGPVYAHYHGIHNRGGMAGDYSPHQPFQCYIIVKHGTFVCYRSYCTCSAGISIHGTISSRQQYSCIYM